MSIWRTSGRRAGGGYTLIELITVCAIIGILVAMAIAAVTKARIQAREAKAIAMVKSFVNVYTTYLAKNGTFPHWGPGQRYATVTDMWTDLGARGYIPRAWLVYPPDPVTGIVRGPVEGYAVEILPYTPDPTGLRTPDTYFALIFRPYGFQTGYIGVTVDPASDRPQAVPLFGESPDLSTMTLRKVADDEQGQLAGGGSGSAGGQGFP